MDLRQLTLSNTLLDQAFSRPDGQHPRYQWKHSEDELMMATPVLTADGTPELDYACPCGINRRVHAVDCSGLTVAQVKFMKTKIDHNLVNCWALAGWLPPPSTDSWASTYGSFQYYPSQGRYIPFNIKVMGMPGASTYIQIPFPHVPFEAVTARIIQVLHDCQANWTRYMDELDQSVHLRDARQMKERWGDPMDYTPPANSKWTNMRDQLKDRMTMLGQLPGTRGAVLRFNAPPPIPVPADGKPLIVPAT